MKKKNIHRMVWFPRVLSIIYISFFLLMSLDSFEGTVPLYGQIIGFLIHNIPTVILFSILILSWERPLINGIFYLALAIVMTIFFHTYRDLINFLVITGPVLLSGLLFVISSFVPVRTEKALPE
jgi:hypothetical protein